MKLIFKANQVIRCHFRLIYVYNFSANCFYSKFITSHSSLWSWYSLLVQVNFFWIRDGPLENWRGEGGGWVSALHTFFSACLLCMFFSHLKSLYGYFFVVYMLSLFYIATCYWKAVKCCSLILRYKESAGINNLQILYSYLNSSDAFDSILYCYKCILLQHHQNHNL